MPKSVHFASYCSITLDTVYRLNKCNYTCTRVKWNFLVSFQLDVRAALETRMGVCR